MATPGLERVLRVGDELPPVSVLLTLQRLVMEAGANRDFSPMHIDRDAARLSGTPDAFANTTLIETLFEATLRSWAGLDAKITMLEFAMHRPNCVGDTMVSRGTVIARDQGEDGSLRARVQLTVHSADLLTVSGQATVVLPAELPEDGGEHEQ